MTLIGYSLPTGDRVAGELVSACDPACLISVVDRDPGPDDRKTGVVGRLRALGRDAVSRVAGPECVPDFVAQRLKMAISALPELGAFEEQKSADVVIAAAHEWDAQLYVLAWNATLSRFEPHAVDLNDMRRSTMPYREIALNSLPRGMRVLDDFVTEARFREHVSGGKPFTFAHPKTGEELVAIGARRLRMDGWDLLQLKWAPLG